MRKPFLNKGMKKKLVELEGDSTDQAFEPSLVILENLLFSQQGNDSP